MSPLEWFPMRLWVYTFSFNNYNLLGTQLGYFSRELREFLGHITRILSKWCFKIYFSINLQLSTFSSIFLFFYSSFLKWGFSVLWKINSSLPSTRNKIKPVEHGGMMWLLFFNPVEHGEWCNLAFLRIDEIIDFIMLAFERTELFQPWITVSWKLTFCSF